MNVVHQIYTFRPTATGASTSNKISLIDQSVFSFEPNHGHQIKLRHRWLPHYLYQFKSAKNSGRYPRWLKRWFCWMNILHSRANCKGTPVPAKCRSHNTCRMKCNKLNFGGHIAGTKLQQDSCCCNKSPENCSWVWDRCNFAAVTFPCFTSIPDTIYPRRMCIIVSLLQTCDYDISLRIQPL